jgi:hypothetical protein
MLGHITAANTMAKIILIIAGVLIVGVVAFIFWFARHPIVFLTKGPGKTVTASVLPDEPSRKTIPHTHQSELAGEELQALEADLSRKWPAIR